MKERPPFWLAFWTALLCVNIWVLYTDYKQASPTHEPYISRVTHLFNPNAPDGYQRTDFTVTSPVIGGGRPVCSASPSEDGLTVVVTCISPTPTP